MLCSYVEIFVPHKIVLHFKVLLFLQYYQWFSSENKTCIWNIALCQDCAVNRFASKNPSIALLASLNNKRGCKSMLHIINVSTHITNSLKSAYLIVSVCKCLSIEVYYQLWKNRSQSKFNISTVSNTQFCYT